MSEDFALDVNLNVNMLEIAQLFINKTVFQTEKLSMFVMPT